MHIIHVSLLLTVAVTVSSKDISENKTEIHVFHVERKDDMKEILADTRRRKYLKTYLDINERFEELEQVRVWELCYRFLLFFSDMPAEDHRIYNIIIKNVTANQQNGNCRKELRIPKQVCKKLIKNKNQNYIEMVVLLKDTISTSLQPYIFEEFVTHEDFWNTFHRDNDKNFPNKPPRTDPSKSRLAGVKNIKDVLRDVDKRNLLKVYLETKKRYDEYEQVRVWEKCDDFIHIHIELPIAKRKFDSIVKNVEDRKMGKCKKELNISDEMCKQFLNKSAGYIDRALTLKEALAKNLQGKVYDELVTHLAWL